MWGKMVGGGRVFAVVTEPAHQISPDSLLIICYLRKINSSLVISGDGLLLHAVRHSLNPRILNSRVCLVSSFSASFSTVYSFRILEEVRDTVRAALEHTLTPSEPGERGSYPLDSKWGEKNPGKKSDWLRGYSLSQLPWTKGRGNMICQVRVT